MKLRKYKLIYIDNSNNDLFTKEVFYFTIKEAKERARTELALTNHTDVKKVLVKCI